MKEYFVQRLGYPCRLEPEVGAALRRGRQLYAVFVDRPFASEDEADLECDELKRRARARPYEKAYMNNFQGAFAVRREGGVVGG